MLVRLEAGLLEDDDEPARLVPFDSSPWRFRGDGDEGRVERGRCWGRALARGDGGRVAGCCWLLGGRGDERGRRDVERLRRKGESRSSHRAVERESGRG